MSMTPTPSSEHPVVSREVRRAEPTPGPWKAGEAAWFRGRTDPAQGKRPITSEVEPGVIANVYGEANAHLIAAAPALYEALEDLLRASVVGGVSDDELNALEAKARAALALSRGES